MKTPFLLAAAAATIFSASSGGVMLTVTGNAAAAPPPLSQQQTAAITVPAAPVLPRNLTFAQELSGRRLFFAALDTYRNASNVAFSAKWVILTGNAPGAKPTLSEGTETVYAAAPERKLSLELAWNQPNLKIVRRVVANGKEMIVTRFEQRSTPDAPPVREFVRVPLDEGVTLPRALAQAQFTPLTRAAQFLVNGNDLPRPTAVLWREALQTVNGVSAEVVAEQEKPNRGDDRHTTRSRRYWVQTETKRLLRYEEWITTQNPPRATRRSAPADDGTRITYRREDYTFLSKPVTTATWSQVLPANYAEKPLPETHLPELAPPPGENMHPRALALLKQWRTAQERFLSYSATVDVVFNAVPRTPQSRQLPPAWTGSASRFLVTWRRPAQTRIEAIAVAKGGVPNFPDAVLAVADGSQVRVTDKTRNRSNTVDIDTPITLWNTLNRAGFSDPWGVLIYLYNPPPLAETYERIGYEGSSTTADGEPVEVITLTRQNTGTGRRNLVSENTIETRIALGADGMPREMTVKREGNISGMFERDQPPVITLNVRYRYVRLNGEPPSTAFLLPQVSQ